MIVAIVNNKGGVGKTTTAVHLAAYLQTLGPTVLIDGDAERSSLAWSERGNGFPYRVATDEEDAVQLVKQYAHTVIDTAQNPEGANDLRAVYAFSDVIVMPTAPASLETHSLARTIQQLRQLGPDKFRVLFTKVARDAAKEAAELRGLLAEFDAPVMQIEIPLLKAYAKAAAAGQIVSQTQDRNAARAWEAYEAAGREISA